MQWLSAMLIVDIRCTDRTPTDRQKPSQPQRFHAVLSRLRAGRTRLSAGCVRLCAGYNGRGLAGAGGRWRYTEAPPRGDCDRAHTYIRVQKFLLKIYGLTPVLRPDRRITSRITHSNELFSLISNKFMLFLSAVSTAKLAVMDPRPKSTVHVHTGRLRER